jgi:hypothetical protein
LAFIIAPTAYYIFNSSPEVVFTNRTEVSNLGLRPIAPVLFMDFNSPNESTYVRDNSLYNNFGILVSSPLYNVTGGYDGSSAYQFDGNERYVSITDSDSLDMNATGEISISAWIKIKGSKKYL